MLKAAKYSKELDMKKPDQTGFSIVELLLILVVIGIIVFTGWYVYQSQETANKGYDSQSSAQDAPAVNQYAGWKTDSLTYEKMSFKYPSTWQISNTSKDEAATGGTATPGADTVTLTSPSGLIVSIQTGEAGVNSSGVPIGLLDSKPVTTLGGSYYLVFYTNKAQSTTEARGACLNKTSTPTGMPLIASKNIKTAGMESDSTEPTANLICIRYPMEGNVTPVKPVSAFEQDASYKDARLIIESLTY